MKGALQVIGSQWWDFGEGTAKSDIRLNSFFKNEL